MPYVSRHDWTREEISSIYPSPLLDLILEAAARSTKKGGSPHFCMGAACRQGRSSSEFERAIQAVKEAGLHSYHHSLDAGEEFYPSIITPRNYQDRLKLRIGLACYTL
ncbi:hypothetical protein [Parachlamydia sp. AcF125]|uniref:hypothetical protein n=1 Tax=Parachlamydia sp. AcF125 TaxID=2795736 RepID=UPI001BD8592B|nr:hypothetical protein [Parachlamydia sp. AcF125]MBS4168345.1 Biotin synthase [Parachlamydia sp. AcF125]